MYGTRLINAKVELTFVGVPSSFIKNLSLSETFFSLSGRVPPSLVAACGFFLFVGLVAVEEFTVPLPKKERKKKGCAVPACMCVELHTPDIHTFTHTYSQSLRLDSFSLHHHHPISLISPEDDRYDL